MRTSSTTTRRLRGGATGLTGAAVFLLALGVAPAAQAADSVAESHLVDAAVAYGKAKREGFAPKELEAFRVAVAKARAEAQSPDLKARIERQQGLYYVVTGAGAAALRSFRAALKYAPKLRLDGEEAATELFDCARRLKPALWDGGPLKLAPDGGWVCPGDPVTPPAAITAAPPPPPKQIELGWKSIVGGGMVLVGGTVGIWEWSRWSGLSDRHDRATAESQAMDRTLPVDTRLAPVREVEEKMSVAKRLGIGGAVLAAGGLGMIAWDIFESEEAAEPALTLSMSPSGAVARLRF